MATREIISQVVAGWVSKEVVSEGEINMQEVYLKTLSGSAPVARKGQEGSRIGWRVDSFSTNVSAVPKGSPKPSRITPLCNRSLSL